MMRGDEHYNYYRNCNPETGRYLQSDPSGYLGDDNSYAYAQANPLAFIDFYGLSSEKIKD